MRSTDGKCKVLVTCHEHDASPTIGSLCAWLKTPRLRLKISLCPLDGTTFLCFLIAVTDVNAGLVPGCLCFRHRTATIYMNILSLVALVASLCVVARADSNLASRRNFNIDDTVRSIVHDNIIIHFQRQGDAASIPQRLVTKKKCQNNCCALLRNVVGTEAKLLIFTVNTHIPNTIPLSVCLSLCLVFVII